MIPTGTLVHHKCDGVSLKSFFLPPSLPPSRPLHFFSPLPSHPSPLSPPRPLSPSSPPFALPIRAAPSSPRRSNFTWKHHRIPPLILAYIPNLHPARPKYHPIVHFRNQALNPLLIQWTIPHQWYTTISDTLRNYSPNLLMNRVPYGFWMLFIYLSGVAFGLDFGLVRRSRPSAPTPSPTAPRIPPLFISSLAPLLPRPVKLTSSSSSSFFAIPPPSPCPSFFLVLLFHLSVFLLSLLSLPFLAPDSFEQYRQLYIISHRFCHPPNLSPRNNQPFYVRTMPWTYFTLR